MQMLLIEAVTEKEKKIRDTVIFRIMRIFKADFRLVENEIQYVIPASRKDEIKQIIDVMNEQFNIALVCRFEPFSDSFSKNL